MVANFNFSGVNRVIYELGLLVRVSKANMEGERAQGYFSGIADDEPDRHKALRQARETVTFVCQMSGQIFPALKCAHIDTALERLRYWLEQSPVRWAELNTRSRALRDAIDTELKEYIYYQYPKSKGAKLKAWDTEWKATLTAFPEIARDVLCAVDCYALRHNTASVFHSMRVAEAGLRALAAERRIKLPKDKPLAWGTWQEIIRALDNEIKLIGSKKAGAVKDAALEFYSGARADLNGFKDEYRNQVMHDRAHYDEHQALRALTNVHAFMERLAAKIDHTNKRIKWGRF